MVRKQKSGCEKRKKEEEKVRSEISNRPGQLKISNFFKDIPVLDESAIENDAETDEFVADSDPIEDTSEASSDRVSFGESENVESAPETVNKIDENSALGNLKLSVKLLTTNYDCLESFSKLASGRNRQFILCNVCKEFEEVAKKYSQNQTVAIANGIKVDSQEKFQRVIDHLEGASHKHAVLAKKNAELWKARSESHHWRKYLNAENEYLVQELIRMAVDVYNDALHGTLPSFNWASRSLAHKRSEQLVNYFNENGFDKELPTFEVTDKILRYRNPSGYNEMLEIVSDIETDKKVQRINNAVCYSIQVDGSVDRTMSDNKFSTLRFIESDGAIQSMFLDVSAPTQNGARGLLEAVMAAIKKLNRENLASFTTDGESANSGPDEGLWKLLEDELGRNILTMWCTCHRSDLALEEMELKVSELTLWKMNVIACATYFRTSKCRTKLLHDFGKDIEILAFPGYNEIRFAEHGESLLKAIIRNLPVCRKVWSSIVKGSSYDYTRKEKLKATSLLDTWFTNSLQCKLTSFMHDVYSVFTSLQKGLQKSHLILPDVMTLRDAATRKLKVIIDGPTPGGEEERILKMIFDKNPMNLSHFLSSTSEQSEYHDIRRRVAQLSESFLSKRLNIEQEKAIQLMKNVLTAKSCATLIHHSVNALKLFTNSEDQEKKTALVSDICEQWPVLRDIPQLETSDIGTKYSNRLRQMFVKSRGQFQWLLGAFAVTSPHSMNTERVVSHFNKNKSPHQENLELKHLSQRLNISLNSVGTSHFDPRPAVTAFLEKKERRFRHADIEIYQTHDFTKKFFRKETTV